MRRLTKGIVQDFDSRYDVCPWKEVAKVLLRLGRLVIGVTLELLILC